jgi:glucose-1-phosphate thymidylyltransferase
MLKDLEVIGLLPAGGLGARIEPLPCSKEIFPIGFGKVERTDNVRPKAVSQYLLEKMRKAGVKKAFFILREGKWDIPKYFGGGASVDMNLGYLMMQLPFGPPYTLDQAYPFVGDSIQLLDRQTATGADVVLGLCPVEQPWTMDMVEADDKGKIRAIVIKPSVSSLGYGWIIAVWSPVFTRFLHEHLQSQPHEGLSQDGMQGQFELSMGHVLQAALKNGVRMEAVQFPQCSYLDIGTPDNLRKAVCDQKFYEAGACYVKQMGA